MSRTALITGASRGIGAAAARTFASAGYSVVLAARSRDALRGVAAGIESRGGRALAIPTDVTDPASVDLLIARATESFGGLDVAFNNAGGGAPPAPLADVDPILFESSLKVNVYGTYLCMRSEIAAMRLRGSGAIVNMTSTAGLQGVAGLGPYCAGKHAIVGLTKVAALDYAAAGIRVNAIAPGPIATERIPDDQRKRIGEFVPIKRVGTPEEVAQLVVWLCSDESAFITGAVVPIDGGRLAGTPSFAISP
jgi:NAD(P)-dependent dehydrogenase (short-subunit alcohol dehydrogenase family)